MGIPEDFQGFSDFFVGFCVEVFFHHTQQTLNPETAQTIITSTAVGHWVLE